MTTQLNKYEEKVATWQSHKHPENPDFMQVVKYMHVQFPDGREHLYWRLANSSANDKHLIAGITLSDAQSLYMDIEDEPITDEMFEKWLLEKQSH